MPIKIWPRGSGGSQRGDWAAGKHRKHFTKRGDKEEEEKLIRQAVVGHGEGTPYL